jgi:hypothetical protein
MAFALAGLRAVATGPAYPGATTAAVNVQKLWHYMTSDATATVTAANYWNSAVALLNKGDIIHSVALTGGTPALTTYVVTSNNGTTVVAAVSL